jgi:hypothetical protein
MKVDKEYVEVRLMNSENAADDFPRQGTLLILILHLVLDIKIHNPSCLSRSDWAEATVSGLVTVMQTRLVYHRLEAVPGLWPRCGYVRSTSLEAIP